MTTKREIQAQYAQVAAQAGDLYFRISALQDSLRPLQEAMAQLGKKKADLEEQLKTASDDDVVEVTPSAE